jgi:DNA-binding GntR family transcriptional regulator
MHACDLQAEDKSYVEQVYSYLRQQIMDSSLRPGDSIGDVELAASLGVSRTPVREALRQLEMEGLLVRTPRRGWTVRILNAQDLEEIFQLKISLETLLTREATRQLTPELKTHLLDAMTTMEQAASVRDQQAWLAADDRLQEILYGAAPNGRARQILSSLNAQWRWIFLRLLSLEERMAQSAREHRAILDRVLVGDAGGAAALVEEHLDSVKRYLLMLLTNFVWPMIERSGGSGK